MCAEYVSAHIHRPQNPPARPSAQKCHHHIAIVLARLLTICIICIGFLIKNCVISLRFFALQLFLRLIFSAFCLQFDFLLYAPPHLAPPRLQATRPEGWLLASWYSWWLLRFACILLSGSRESIMLIYFYSHSDCNLCDSSRLGWAGRGRSGRGR